MLTNLKSGRPSGDRFELAAHILGRVGLHIKALMLGQAAREKNENARLGFPSRLHTAGRRSSLLQAR